MIGFVVLPLLLVSSLSSSLLANFVEGGDINFQKALNNFYGCSNWGAIECLECSTGYFFNDDKICSKVPQQCKKYNRGVGICEQCYLGYTIYSGQCIMEEIANSLNLGCRRFEEGSCVECSARWFLGNSGHCEPVDDLCRKWNQNSGACTDCYLGYNLDTGKCVKSQARFFGAIDTFCGQWEGRTCLRCAQRAYLGPVGLCIPVNNYCRTWDKLDGFCLTCYLGYTLSHGNCEISANQTNGPSDIGCGRWDWENQICLQCSQRWVLIGNYCTPVPDNCLTFYEENGTCQTCYMGFDLVNGNCLYSASNEEKPSDLGCRLWNWEELKCLQCSLGWYFNSEKQCTPVSDFCKRFSVSGRCLECFWGYDLVRGNCLRSTHLSEPTDPGCKIWDWEEQVCMQCSYRWVFLNNGTCQEVSDLCDQFDGRGNCLTCYKGYKLNKGQCIRVQLENCLLAGDGICEQCYPGFILSEGECYYGNPLCQTNDGAGRCTSCFKAYALYLTLVTLAEKLEKCCPKELQALRNSVKLDKL